MYNLRIFDSEMCADFKTNYNQFFNQPVSWGSSYSAFRDIIYNPANSNAGKSAPLVPIVLNIIHDEASYNEYISALSDVILSPTPREPSLADGNSLYNYVKTNDPAILDHLTFKYSDPAIELSFIPIVVAPVNLSGLTTKQQGMDLVNTAVTKSIQEFNLIFTTLEARYKDLNPNLRMETTKWFPTNICSGNQERIFSISSFTSSQLLYTAVYCNSEFIGYFSNNRYSSSSYFAMLPWIKELFAKQQITDDVNAIVAFDTMMIQNYQPSINGLMGKFKISPYSSDAKLLAYNTVITGDIGILNGQLMVSNNSRAGKSSMGDKLVLNGYFRGLCTNQLNPMKFGMFNQSHEARIPENLKNNYPCFFWNKVQVDKYDKLYNGYGRWAYKLRYTILDSEFLNEVSEALETGDAFYFNPSYELNFDKPVRGVSFITTKDKSLGYGIKSTKKLQQDYTAYFNKILRDFGSVLESLVYCAYLQEHFTVAESLKDKYTKMFFKFSIQKHRNGDMHTPIEPPNQLSVDISTHVTKLVTEFNNKSLSVSSYNSIFFNYFIKPLKKELKYVAYWATEPEKEAVNTANLAIAESQEAWMVSTEASYTTASSVKFGGAGNGSETGLFSSGTCGLANLICAGIRDVTHLRDPISLNAWGDLRSLLLDNFVVPMPVEDAVNELTASTSTRWQQVGTIRNATIHYKQVLCLPDEAVLMLAQLYACKSYSDISAWIRSFKKDLMKQVCRVVAEPHNQLRVLYYLEYYHEVIDQLKEKLKNAEV